MHFIFVFFICVLQVNTIPISYSAENSILSEPHKRFSKDIKEAICDEWVTKKPPQLNQWDEKNKLWALFKSPLSEAEAIRFLLGDLKKPWLSIDLSAKWKSREAEEFRRLKEQQSLEFCQNLGAPISSLKLLEGKNFSRWSKHTIKDNLFNVLIEDVDGRAIKSDMNVVFGGWIEPKEVRWMKYNHFYYLRLKQPMSDDFSDLVLLDNLFLPIARLQLGASKTLNLQESYFSIFEKLIQQNAQDALDELERKLSKKYVQEEVQKKKMEVREMVEFYLLLLQAYLVSPEQELVIKGKNSLANKPNSNDNNKMMEKHIRGVLNEVSLAFQPVTAIFFNRNKKMEAIYIHFLEKLQEKLQKSVENSD